MTNEKFTPRTVNCTEVGARPVDKTMKTADQAVDNVKTTVEDNLKGALVDALKSGQCVTEGAKAASEKHLANADTTFADTAKEIALEKYQTDVDTAKTEVKVAKEELKAAEEALKAKQEEEAEAADSTEDSTEPKAEGSEETTEEVSPEQEAVNNAQTALATAEKSLKEAQAERTAAKKTPAKEFVA